MLVTDASAERPTRLNPQTRVGGINFSVVSSIGPSTASTPETHWGISPRPTNFTSDPHNAFNQLTASTRTAPGQPNLSTTYVYDNNGNLTSETAGNALTTYTWDADNRLRQVTQPTLLSTYEYDANGLRTKKVEGGVETRFLLDGVSVLSEYDSSNVATRRYLQNPQSIDDILELSEGGQNYFPLTDALGSVVAITDSAGTVVRRNDYEVYGARSSTGTSLERAFGFTGREQDVSGLNYNRNRFFMARTGNWLQPDRAGMIAGVNLYGYVRNLPTSLTDPTGLIPRQPFETWLDAVFDALRYTKMLVDVSTAAGNPREYAGAVYQSFGGYYTYEEPLPGNAWSSDPENNPSGTTVSAFFHGHPDARARFPQLHQPDQFSEQDYLYAEQKGKPTFLIGPLGIPQAYFPAGSGLKNWISAQMWGLNGTQYYWLFSMNYSDEVQSMPLVSYQPSNTCP